LRPWSKIPPFLNPREKSRLTSSLKLRAKAVVQRDLKNVKQKRGGDNSASDNTLLQEKPEWN